MNFSYREIGLIASLAVTLLVFGNYFLGFFANIDAATSGQNGSSDLIRLVILVVILEVIIHSFLAILYVEQLRDERDQLIQRMAYRNSYWFLIVSLWFVVVQLLAIGSDGWFGVDYLALFTTSYGLAHLLLLLFVLAEVINFITQLYYYRKGI